MYYFAYGTNLNCRIFQKKFKNAIKIRKYTLKNFRLVFQTKYKVPDIHFSKRDNVKGIIYKIDKEIEKKLDKYEDYPYLYIKKYFYHGKKRIMYYLMKKKTPIKKPSGYYFKIMKNGYRQNNFKFPEKFL